MKTQFLSSISPLWLLLIAATILLFLANRRFKRRGLGGLEHFPDYWTGLFTIIGETALKWLAYLIIIIALYKLIM